MENANERGANISRGGLLSRRRSVLSVVFGLGPEEDLAETPHEIIVRVELGSVEQCTVSIALLRVALLSVFERLSLDAEQILPGEFRVKLDATAEEEWPRAQTGDFVVSLQKPCSVCALTMVVSKLRSRDFQFVVCLGGSSTLTADTKCRSNWLTEEMTPACVLDMLPQMAEARTNVYFALVSDLQRPLPEITIVIRRTVRRLDVNGKSFTCYQVCVQQDFDQWIVDKRFSQFQSLVVELKAQVSSDRLASLPPFPGKNRWWRRSREDRERKRLIHLSLWLKALVVQMGVRPNSLVLSFLGLLAKRNHSNATLALKTVCELARVGDLILFKSVHSAARLQRRFTGARWDHVGVVVSKENAGGMHLLEATGEGITCIDLSCRLRAYAYYSACECIAVRQRGGLGEPNLVELAEFLREIQFKSYAFNLTDLTGVLSKDASASERETVFCSSLSAGALKAAGIINSSKNEKHFWPGCFAPHSNIDLSLAPGFTYGPEILIELQDLEVSNSRHVTPLFPERSLPPHGMPGAPFVTSFLGVGK